MWVNKDYLNMRMWTLLTIVLVWVFLIADDRGIADNNEEDMVVELEEKLYVEKEKVLELEEEIDIQKDASSKMAYQIEMLEAELEKHKK